MIRRFFSLLGICLICLTFLSIASIKNIEDKQNPPTSSVAVAAATPSEVLERVSKVYDRIVDAIGDKRKAVPELVLSEKKRLVAGMNPTTNEVVLEMAAYRVCAQFGERTDDALAVLMGHELAHYYEEHAWLRDYGTAYGDPDLGRELKAAGINIKEIGETEADTLGLMYGYLAGYNTLGISGELLPKLYSEYGLPHEIPGYPSLEERISMAQHSQEYVSELISAFETANLLVAFGDYEAAAETYRFLIKSFPSREIYSNAAVSNLLAVLNDRENEEFKSYSQYAYPLELDAESRMNQSGIKGAMGFSSQSKKYLEEAMTYLNRAIALDPSYLPAVLNKAIAFELQGEVEDADYFAGKVIRNKAADNDMKAKAKLVQYIAASRSGNAGDAATYLKEAIELSAKNLFLTLILNTNESSELTLDADPFGFSKPEAEKIDGMTAKDAIMQTQAKPENRSSYDDLPLLADASVVIHSSNGSMIFENRQLLVFNHKKNRWVSLFATPMNYEGKGNTGISLGMSAEAAVKMQGKAQRELAFRGGKILAYDEAKLLLVFDSNERLEKWVIMHSEKY